MARKKTVLKFHINWLLAVCENQKFMPQFKLIMVHNPLLGYLAEIIPVVVKTFILFPLSSYVLVLLFALDTQNHRTV